MIMGAGPMVFWNGSNAPLYYTDVNRAQYMRKSEGCWMVQGLKFRSVLYFLLVFVKGNRYLMENVEYLTVHTLK